MASLARTLRPVTVPAFFLVLGTAACASTRTSPPPPSAPLPARPSDSAADDAPPEDPAQAVRYFEARVARFPEDVEGWQRLTSSLRRVNRLQEAARAGWRAVELASTWQSWATLGNVLMQGQARRGAWAAFEMAGQGGMDPDDLARSFLNIGYRDWALGDDQHAVEAVTRAEKASPENAQVHYDRASLMAATGRPDEARRSAQRALDLLAKIPETKLPTASAREALQTMRALLERMVAGEKVDRPPLVEPGQELPPRFWRDEIPKGRALELAIDADSYRFYPLGSGRLFRIRVPSRWNEAARVSSESTYVKLAADGAVPAAVVQITALIADRPIDLRRAAEQGAEVVRQGGGHTEPLQPLSGGGFWFWSTDPHAKPGDANDYPFLGQAFMAKDGVLLSTTLLTRSDSPADRKVLADVMDGAGMRRIAPSKP